MSASLPVDFGAPVGTFGGSGFCDLAPVGTGAAATGFAVERCCLGLRGKTLGAATFFGDPAAAGVDDTAAVGIAGLAVSTAIGTDEGASGDADTVAVAFADGTTAAGELVEAASCDAMAQPTARTASAPKPSHRDKLPVGRCFAVMAAVRRVS